MSKCSVITKRDSSDRVLVLLAAYNGEAWIEEQILSILKQRDVEVSILISVDRSTDNTNAICKQLSDVYPNIMLLSYGERFGGAAANFFRLIGDADFTSYDYVALADQDDIWFEDKLFYSTMKMQTLNADAFSSNVIAFWENGKEVLVKKSYPQKRFDFFFEAAGPGCTYVFKSSAIEAFKKFILENESSIAKLALHDWTIYAYFRSYGYCWHIDDRPLLNYRQHASNQVGTNYGLKAFTARFLLIKNNWYGKQVWLLYLLFADKVPEFKLTKLFLLKHCFQLRRRYRDAVFLFFVIAFNKLY